MKEREDVWESDSDDSIGSERTSEDSNEYEKDVRKKLQKPLTSGKYFVIKLTGNMNLPT